MPPNTTGGFFIMETILILITIGAMNCINIVGLSWIYHQVKKGNKDQQEIKTRLFWIKKRQLQKK